MAGAAGGMAEGEGLREVTGGLLDASLKRRTTDYTGFTDLEEWAGASGIKNKKFTRNA